MRVLILTTNTGSGHNSAAKALFDAFEKEGDYVEVKNFLLFASERHDKFTCELYKDSVKYIPYIFGGIYKLGEVLDKIQRGAHSIVYGLSLRGSTNLNKYCIENKFDLVLSVHYFGCFQLSYANNKYGPVPYIRVGLMTDYSRNPFLKEADLDSFIIPHQECLEDFHEKYMRTKRVEAIGIPTREQFKHYKSKSEAKRLLNLDETKRYILVMAGGMGSKKSIKAVSHVLKEIKDLDDVCINLICSNNKSVIKTALRKFKNNPKVNVIDFTEDVNTYIDASEVYVSKGGGSSSTEAQVAHVPFIVTMPIPGLEKYNGRLFNKLGTAIYAPKLHDAAKKTRELLDNEEMRNEMIENQKKHINPYAAEDTVKYCHKLYDEKMNNNK